MGIVWQIVIFIGGIIPAILGVTGLIMAALARLARGDGPAQKTPARSLARRVVARSCAMA